MKMGVGRGVGKSVYPQRTLQAVESNIGCCG
jgi:hypothetical protein